MFDAASVINWVDLLFVGPFLLVMSTGYYSPMLLRVVGMGVILMNLWDLLIWGSGTGAGAEGSTVRPKSYGQSKVEYSKSPATRALDRFPNEVFMRY